MTAPLLTPCSELRSLFVLSTQHLTWLSTALNIGHLCRAAPFCWCWISFLQWTRQGLQLRSLNLANLKQQRFGSEMWVRRGVLFAQRFDKADKADSLWRALAVLGGLINKLRKGPQVSWALFSKNSCRKLSVLPGNLCCGSTRLFRNQRFFFRFFGLWIKVQRAVVPSLSLCK